MHEVTDIAFRQVVVRCGKPDVLYTEFISCDGLLSKGREKLLDDLRFEKNEHLIVAQFFGTKPEQFYKCAKLAQELGFDGIDINMGCPDRKILKQGAGAALIKDPMLAQEIIAAALEGNLPVSVKTRIGYGRPELDAWIRPVLDARPDTIVIHGRTVMELSKKPVHWDIIGQISQMSHECGVICVGNGDIESREQGIELADKHCVDGIMVGRGIFHDPWLFSGRTSKETKEERLALLLEHVKLFEKYWPDKHKNFATLKKFFKIYISGWRGSSELRAKLMGAHNSREVEDIVYREFNRQTLKKTSGLSPEAQEK